MIRLWRLAALLLALAWCVSLALPVATFGPGADEIWAGWAVLMLGWLGFMLGQFAWLANFLFIAALILMSLRRPPRVWSLVIGGATSLLALHALSWTWVYRNEGPATEPSAVLGYGAGYYLWIAATVAAGALLCAAALLRPRTAA